MIIVLKVKLLMYCHVENRPPHVVMAENPVGNEAIVITVCELDETIRKADATLLIEAATSAARAGVQVEVRQYAAA